jgi:hypothetical protein
MSDTKIHIAGPKGDKQRCARCHSVIGTNWVPGHRIGMRRDGATDLDSETARESAYTASIYGSARDCGPKPIAQLEPITARVKLPNIPEWK